VIYSAAFDALPADAKKMFYGRLNDVLRGADKSPDFAALSAADRGAILEILRATKPSSYRPPRTRRERRRRVEAPAAPSP